MFLHSIIIETSFFYVVYHYNNMGVCGMFKLSTFSNAIPSKKNVLKDIYTCLAIVSFPMKPTKREKTPDCY